MVLAIINKSNIPFNNNNCVGRFYFATDFPSSIVHHVLCIFFVWWHSNEWNSGCQNTDRFMDSSLSTVVVYYHCRFLGTISSKTDSELFLNFMIAVLVSWLHTMTFSKWWKSLLRSLLISFMFHQTDTPTQVRTLWILMVQLGNDEWP